MNILFISASFPYLKDGIGDSASFLYKEFIKKEKIFLLTYDKSEIKKYIGEEQFLNVYYMNNWKLNKDSVKYIKSIINKNKIDTIHIEYPGCAYGKNLLVNFLPLFIKLMFKNKIKVYLRLHEFTQARLIRKIVIIPMIFFSNKIYVPALSDWKCLNKLFGEKIKKTLIGSNIPIKSNVIKDDSEDINLAYFGFVYHNKGIERLLNIFSKIKGMNLQRKIKFTIIGEISDNNDNHFAEYHKKVLQMIESLNLKNDIRVTGYLSDEEVSGEISKVDIALLPFDDGLSLRRGSFLTFLNHGVTIVTSEGDKECEELFSSSEGVKMCSTNEEMIDTILKLSEDKKKLELIGESNREIAKKFSWKNICEIMINDYKKD